MFHAAFCMHFRGVLVAKNATHFLGWWIRDSLALGVALPRQGYPYNYHVIIISLGRISFTGDMICGWPRNSSWVGATHVLRYLPWYHEGTERNVGSRTLGMLVVLANFSIIWTYKVDEGRIYNTLSFLEWFSSLFQYTKKMEIPVKCWEIHSRAMGWDFPLGEFNQGSSGHGMEARHLKIEENRGKCTEQVLQLEANLYAMPCPARCCWGRSPVNAPAWAEAGSQEVHFWWHLYQWCAWSCKVPWDAFLDGIMTLESSVTLASSERCQLSSPQDVNYRNFHR